MIDMDLDSQMNKIRVTIKSIEESEGITKIISNFASSQLIAVTLELWQNINIEDEAFFVFKETEVGIAKEFSGQVSFSNVLDGKIVDLDIGKILTKVIIKVENTEISSIITTSSARVLNLDKNDQVKLFIKATEISIEEIGE